MTDEERSAEGAEESIEDLEAPAKDQEDVAGGGCIKHTAWWCKDPTCRDTKHECHTESGGGVVRHQ